MTRTISLIVGVAVVALAVGVPTAFGKGQQPSAVDYFRANELSTLVQSGNASAVDYFRANERSTLAQSGGSAPVGYRDAHERTVDTGNQPIVATYRDSFERVDLPRGSVPVSVTATGSDIEWPQIGVGLGIGLLLALGLGLIMRTVHVRPFAH